MLRVVTGPFHPDLELALVEEVRQLKAADPLAPLAIIVPSDPLRRRLKWLLCGEQRCALLNVHFLTFYQFSIRLLEDAGIESSTRIRAEFFFKELIHHLLRLQTAARSRWNLSGLVEMPGAWGAIWATLRDLKDAQVDADLDADGLEPGLRSLLDLYRMFRDEKTRTDALDQDDLAALAKDCVGTPRFLGCQRRLLYYGFYDLTQVQLDLFQAVARGYPTTLYFPLVKGHPAFPFAERFFERYIHGLITQESDCRPAPSSQPEAGRSLARLFADGETSLPTHRPACRIVNVSGREDEITVVAKEILRLVEEGGYAFQDIGVVARTLSGYETVVPRVFDQHGIPFTSTMSRSLAEFPIIKTAIQLLELQVSGFRRDHVIDLLSSPFIRMAGRRPSGPTLAVGGGSAPRPDLWDIASRRVGITRGLDEWRRLTAFLEEGLPLRDDEDGTGESPRIPADQIRGLWSAVSTLADALSVFPGSASWAEYADEAQALFERFVESFVEEAAVPSADGPREVAVALHDKLDELRQLSRIGNTVSLADFAEAFRRLMGEAALPIGSTMGAGVQVLDAMAARGLPFRALFLVGLNEKVFPRHIHEDAFLRDRARRLLEMDLGFKIQEKLAGYDEEKLLFYLLCNSAGDELTLLYQRTDEAGRTQVPSGYLDEVKRVLGDETELAVPRRLTQKFEEALLYRIERLTPSELGVKLLMNRRVPRRLLETVHPAGRLVERGLSVLRAQESGEARLGRHDGITGTLDAFWRTLKTRGVSPTGLQEYATCPFRYFAGQVLRLDPLTVPEAVDQIGPVELGTLAHEILRTCLQKLRELGYFTQSDQPPVDPRAILEEAAQRTFEQFARSHSVGYPLVWELHREGLLSFLREVLHEDLEELAGMWEPILFEETMRGTLAVALPDGLEEFPISGRLDRVDWSASRNTYRIIDYKFKSGNTPGSLDTNLPLGAVRGRRLQPPLYLIVAQASVPARLKQEEKGSEPSCEGLWFYYLAPNWAKDSGCALTRVRFPGDAWTSGLQAPLERVMRQVLGGIRSGLFFIYPGGYCDQCEYRLMCRKTHQPSSWRARIDHPRVRPLRELQRVKPPDGRAADRDAARVDAKRAEARPALRTSGTHALRARASRGKAGRQPDQDD